MRWILRNQEKIKAHFEPHGDEILERIKQSLNHFFTIDRSYFPPPFKNLEGYFDDIPGEKYPIISINDMGNENRMIEFYVVGKQFDVYKLAFRGFTKC